MKPGVILRGATSELLKQLARDITANTKVRVGLVAQGVRDHVLFVDQDFRRVEDCRTAIDALKQALAQLEVFPEPFEVLYRLDASSGFRRLEEIIDELLDRQEWKPEPLPDCVVPFTVARFYDET